METALPLPPPKRARKESVDLADAASAQRFAEVIESSRQLYPVVMTLLAEFDGELAPAMRADGGGAPPFATEADVSRFVELLFLLRHLRNGAHLALADSVLKADSLEHQLHPSAAGGGTRRADDHKQLQARLAHLDQLVAAAHAWFASRLVATGASRAGSPGRAPRVYRLAQRYALSAAETRLLQLLVVFQGAQTDAARAGLLDDSLDSARRRTLIERLVGVCD